MNKIIELILFKSKKVDWGWVFYPAHEADKSLFVHCTGMIGEKGLEYIYKGGVVHDKWREMVMPNFELHGVSPVIVDLDKADWDIPMFPEDKIDGNNPAEESGTE